MSEEVEIKDIIVPPGRFREADKKKVEELKDSFWKFGQLQAIIIDQNKNLVAGLHRLEAARGLDWETIRVEFQESTDELFLREIELEENIRRKQMTWQEEQAAITLLHNIRLKQDPNWNQSMTGALVNSNRQADVSEAIQITNAMKLFPELADAKSKNQAMSWLKHKVQSVVRVLDVKDRPADYSDIEAKLWLGDSVDLIKQVPDESFNAIITDPPFGISYDERKDGTLGGLSSYRDDEENYLRLLGMAPDLFRVIKPNGWLVWFLGISWYERAKQVFRDAGFIVDELPIIWDRSEGRAFTTRPDRYFGRVYDIALHCIKGEPQIVTRSPVRGNIIKVAPVGTSERDLLVERPVELYAELIRRLTVKGESVADFFSGSGSCLAAAAMLGRDFFGCELDPERRAVAIKKIKSHVPKN
jgi:DNA modification methylase